MAEGDAKPAQRNAAIRPPKLVLRGAMEMQEMQTLVLDEHCLVWLEHGLAHDRLRRFDYDRIAAIVTGRTIPVWRILLLLLLLGLPGLVWLLTGQTGTALAIGVLLLGTAVVAALSSIIVRRTHIIVYRGGESRRFAVMARARDVDSFLQELIRRIEAAQGGEAEATSHKP